MQLLGQKSRRPSQQQKLHRDETYNDWKISREKVSPKSGHNVTSTGDSLVNITSWAHVPLVNELLLLPYLRYGSMVDGVVLYHFEINDPFFSA